MFVWHYIQKLPVQVYRQLLNLRISSIMAHFKSIWIWRHNNNFLLLLLIHVIIPVCIHLYKPQMPAAHSVLWQEIPCHFHIPPPLSLNRKESPDCYTEKNVSSNTCNMNKVHILNNYASIEHYFVHVETQRYTHTLSKFKKVPSPDLSAKNSMTNVMLQARHIKLQVTT